MSAKRIDEIGAVTLTLTPVVILCLWHFFPAWDANVLYWVIRLACLIVAIGWVAVRCYIDALESREFRRQAAIDRILREATARLTELSERRSSAIKPSSQPPDGAARHCGDSAESLRQKRRS
jgi:hypothetical protein